MFSINEAIKYGWNKAKEHMELVLFSTLLILALGFLTGNEKFNLINLLVTIFLLIVRIGYTKIFLRIYDGETPKFSDIFKEYRTFWKYLGVSILVPLATLGGLILLIIPGIIWAVRFSFSSIIVIDNKIGPIVAMKESYAITKGSFWKILLFWIVIAVFNILGFLALGIGLLITIPVSTLASIYVYRFLSQKRAGIMETHSTPSPQSA